MGDFSWEVEGTIPQNVKKTYIYLYRYSCKGGSVGPVVIEIFQLLKLTFFYFYEDF